MMARVDARRDEMREAVPDFDHRRATYRFGLSRAGNRYVSTGCPVAELWRQQLCLRWRQCQRLRIGRALKEVTKLEVEKYVSTRGLLAAGKERDTTPLEAARLKRNEESLIFTV